MKELTPKQREVMELVCSGKTNEEIALILNKSVSTVRHTLFWTSRKLDAHARTLMVAKYLAPERFKK